MISIPKGVVWQDSRQQALRAIPSGSIFSFNDPITLYEWRKKGSFRVINLSKKGFTIECAAVDVGSAILGDVESLFNHLAEHRVCVYQAVKQNNWFSPSWLLVTIYYWGLFSTLILSRLLGKSVLFLDGKTIKDFKVLLGNSDGKINPGTYCLEIGESVSANSNYFHLVKLKENNFHECVWKQFYLDSKTKFDVFANEDTDQYEYRMYKCLAFLDSSDHWAWASELRNIVNYRSGFSYNALRNQPVLPLVKYIKNYSLNSLDSLISEYELTIGETGGGKNVASHPFIYSKLLFLKTMLVTRLCEEIYQEILDRHKLDARWELRRKKFYKDLELNQGQSIWPFQ